MKTGRWILALLLFAAFFAIFGNKGLVGYFHLKEEVVALKEENKLIQAKNDALKKNISLLRNDLKYIEMVARNDLGMVKKGDLVYQFIE
jgi:cell division protein FtsB